MKGRGRGATANNRFSHKSSVHLSLHFFLKHMKRLNLNVAVSRMTLYIACVHENNYNPAHRRGEDASWKGITKINKFDKDFASK